MAEDVSIPKRAVFKPAEVCTIAGVQPYILRSWEAEFPALARAKQKGGPRVYRRADVEMVLQIKALVFDDGLTLGAAHRKVDSEKKRSPSVDDQTLLVGLFDSNIRDRILGVKRGLQEVLNLLSSNGRAAAAAPTKPAASAKRAAKATKTAKTKVKKVAKRKRSA